MTQSQFDNLIVGDFLKYKNGNYYKIINESKFLGYEILGVRSGIASNIPNDILIRSYKLIKYPDYLKNEKI